MKFSFKPEQPETFKLGHPFLKYIKQVHH